jgi:hypothetical protein
MTKCIIGLLFLAVVFMFIRYSVHRVLINIFLDILGLEPKGTKDIRMEMRMDRLQSNIEETVISPSQL